jgi:hypothetical protein
MIQLHSAIADTLGRTSGNQTVVASGHLFYLAHGDLGSFQTGQKGRTSPAVYKSDAAESLSSWHDHLTPDP